MATDTPRRTREEIAELHRMASLMYATSYAEWVAAMPNSNAAELAERSKEYAVVLRLLQATVPLFELALEESKKTIAPIGAAGSASLASTMGNGANADVAAAATPAGGESHSRSTLETSHYLRT